MMNSRYRTFYFLLGTLGIGLLLIFGMYLTYPTSKTDTSAPIIATDGHATLEHKIYNMDMKTFSPSLYNALLIEINMGYDQKLFNVDIQKMLKDQLDRHYQDLAYKKLNAMLGATTLDYGKATTIIQHIESTFGVDNRLASIKSNLKAIEYYSNVLPKKVNAFIAKGYGGFEEEHYNTLKRELIATPLNVKKRKAVSTNVTQSLQRLNAHYQGYTDWYMGVMQ